MSFQVTHGLKLSVKNRVCRFGGPLRKFGTSLELNILMLYINLKEIISSIIRNTKYYIQILDIFL